MISLKPGVKVAGVQPEIVLALIVAESVWQPRSLVVTSLRDGSHMPGSKHYEGKAADLRLPVATDHHALRSALAAALGTEFDVVLEETHIHVELDPKAPPIT